MSESSTPLLRLTHLQLDLQLHGEARRVIHDVTLDLGSGESLGVVGESGSGKSMTARSIMQLLPRGARISGEVIVDGVVASQLRGSALRRFRATDVAMIYQNPRAHINPLRTIGDFLTEAPLRVLRRPAEEVHQESLETLRSIGIADAERRMHQYPHQLSGGLLQRVMIAAALMVHPKLILADEPTTALDVTTQEEVVAILDEQRAQRGVAMMFITHDIELAAAIADEIVVMYAGTVVEKAPAGDLHSSALHPYTVGLLAARPTVGRDRLQAIPGRPAAAFEVGPGCVFADRCAYVQPQCRQTRPVLRDLGTHSVACHRVEEIHPAADAGVVAR